MLAKDFAFIGTLKLQDIRSFTDILHLHLLYTENIPSYEYFYLFISFFSSLYLNSFTCNIRITIFLSTCCNNHTVSENSQIVLYFWIFKDESCETINPRYTCYDRYKYVLLKMKIWYNMINPIHGMLVKLSYFNTFNPAWITDGLQLLHIIILSE